MQMWSTFNTDFGWRLAFDGQVQWNLGTFETAQEALEFSVTADEPYFAS